MHSAPFACGRFVYGARARVEGPGDRSPQIGHPVEYVGETPRSWNIIVVYVL